MKRDVICFLFLLMSVCGLLACGKKTEEQKELKEGEYYLYYTNEEHTKLQSEVYATELTGTEALAVDLLESLQQVPGDMGFVSAVPEKVKVLRIEMGGEGQMFVYFNAAYNAMPSRIEILCRAAVVKTLTQIDGVDFVGFYVNDQPLVDATKNAINMMSASSFVDHTGKESAEMQRAQLILYFADESGASLVETEKSVVYSAGISMEQLVVNQLIAGADGETSFDTLPEDTELLNVSVKSGICYVNFDSAFLDNPLKVSEYIPIYSVVNSLTELPNINKVQISIDGVSNVKFRDSISLEQPLERKLDYVKHGDEEESSSVSP